jgi:UDP-hydrolysing UDP-N-acetyl-D-glucosamine 2-epimerase
MKKFCFLTGTRADYGLILPAMQEMQTHPAFQLQLIVMGTHTVASYGNTIDGILADGWKPDAVLDTFTGTENGGQIAESISRVTSECAKAYAKLQPDLLMVPGDRYEMLGAAMAAAAMNIPMAHMCGGDVTEAAYDDAIRHALTKMAQVHFCTNEDARRRIIQMGEKPDRVFLVGASSLDYIRTMPPMCREELEAAIGVAFRDYTLLITFHPVTREGDSVEQLENLLAALDALDDRHLLLFTMPNADQEGEALGARVREFAGLRGNRRFYHSLGHKLYIQVMRHASMVVGNSSSGLSEAPSFMIPTVDIGDRQKGRIRGASIVHCPPQAKAIVEAIEYAKALDCRRVENPYGDGHACERIIEVLESIPDFHALLGVRNDSFHKFTHQR